MCLSLTLLVFCFTFVGIFKSNQQLTQVLDKADFYTAASKLIAGQINSQLTGEEKEVNLAKQSIEQGISSQLARATLQPLQIALISWLTSEQDDLRLDLDLQSIKTKVTSSVSNPDIKFSLTKLIPDTLELTKSDGIQSDDRDALKRAKMAYQTANDAIPILALIVVGASVLLFIINIRKGSKKFTSIFFSAVTTSIFGLLAVGLSYPVEGLIGAGNTTSQQELGMNISIRLLLAVIQQTLWYFIIIGIIGVSGIILARIVFKKRDKKLKDKKKK